MTFKKLHLIVFKRETYILYRFIDGKLSSVNGKTSRNKKHKSWYTYPGRYKWEDFCDRITRNSAFWEK